MFKFLTSKKGFTLVELMIVLALLSLGSVALMNLAHVAYKSFDSSEQRYIKQEAVKEVARLLQSADTNVAAARNADIFNTINVVPSGESVDDSFSYLFAVESYNEDSEFEGYFLYVQNKKMNRASAIKLSETPIYVEIKPYYETITKYRKANDPTTAYSAPKQFNSVTVELSALEPDYEMVDKNGDGVTDPPISDDKYYSLDVTYHFPNMATSETSPLVNHKTASQLSTASLYDSNGNITSTSVYAIHCGEHGGPDDICSNEHNGKCSTAHCGCKIKEVHECSVCDCLCSGKKGIVLRVYCDSIISPDNTEADISVPSMCFIATASYGLDSGEVGALCEFRDECLQTNALGRAFVKAYYTISPPIAEFISESEPLKACVRLALKPLLVVSEYALNEDIRAEGFASFAILMLCGASATAVLVKVDVRKKKNK